MTYVRAAVQEEEAIAGTTATAASPAAFFVVPAFFPARVPSARRYIAAVTAFGSGQHGPPPPGVADRRPVELHR
jgi:hypothetical protein